MYAYFRLHRSFFAVNVSFFTYFCTFQKDKPWKIPGDTEDFEI